MDPGKDFSGMLEEMKKFACRLVGLITIDNLDNFSCMTNFCSPKDSLNKEYTDDSLKNDWAFWESHKITSAKEKQTLSSPCA